MLIFNNRVSKLNRITVLPGFSQFYWFLSNLSFKPNRTRLLQRITVGPVRSVGPFQFSKHCKKGI